MQANYARWGRNCLNHSAKLLGSLALNNIFRCSRIRFLRFIDIFVRFMYKATPPLWQNKNNY